jgi:aspartate/methionine/tyrosine aminotransferase
VLELNSLSKSHNMAGWRIGLLAGGKAYIDTVLKVKSNMDSGMFLPLQRAAIEALTLPDSWHQARNAVYEKRRTLALEILTLLNCSVAMGQEGLFLWAKLPEGAGNSEAFIDRILLEAGVFLTPGFIFGSAGEGYVRISLCATDTRFEEAINRIREFKM